MLHSHLQPAGKASDRRFCETGNAVHLSNSATAFITTCDMFSTRHIIDRMQKTGSNTFKIITF